MVKNFKDKLNIELNYLFTNEKKRYYLKTFSDNKNLIQINN